MEKNTRTQQVESGRRVSLCSSIEGGQEEGDFGAHEGMSHIDV